MTLCYLLEYTDSEYEEAVLLYCLTFREYCVRSEVVVRIHTVQLFTRRAARVLYSNQRLQRWCFDVELLFLAQHLGVPVVEASVNWTEIPGGPFSASHILRLLVLHEQTTALILLRPCHVFSYGSIIAIA